MFIVLRFLHGLASAVQNRFGCMHVGYFKVEMLGRADLDQLSATQRRLNLPFTHSHFDLLGHTLEVLLEIVHVVSDYCAALEVLSLKVAISFLNSLAHLLDDRLAQPDAVRAVFGG
jgi:type III secretory pathway component EscU